MPSFIHLLKKVKTILTPGAKKKKKQNWVYHYVKVLTQAGKLKVLIKYLLNE